MITKLLKAKHWQIFLLTFAVPFILQYIVTIWTLSNLRFDFYSHPEKLLEQYSILPHLGILFYAVTLAWFWAIPMGLRSKIPAEFALNLKWFKILFFVPLIYFIAFIFIFNALWNAVITAEDGFNFGLIGIFVITVPPLHLFSIFCSFYVIYIAAKTFKTAELQREVKFGDFVAEFFLILFYPIGVWFIQPKINILMEEQGAN